MPRPLLHLNSTNKQDNKLSLSMSKLESKTNNLLEINKILRQKRSTEYMNAIHSLDAGGHAMLQDKIKEIIKIIEKEFPEIELPSILVGYVAKCYLGKPYEVHTLTLCGDIVEHYKEGQPLPGIMEKARSLAIWGGYDYIEVYVDCCRAINSDGSVSVIKN